MKKGDVAVAPLTPRKALNALKVVSSYLTGLELPIAPIQIDIEPTARCNLRCRMCPNPNLQRERGFMDLALFREVVDQTAATTVEYHFDMMGEPTLHPDLLSMLSYAVKAGARVALYTNLTRRNDELMRGLGRGGVDRIIVNLSATDAETYATIHGRDRFETVLSNLALVRASREELGATRPRVIISHLEMEGNRHELTQVGARLEPLCDQLWEAPICDWLGTPEIKPLLPPDLPPVVPLKCSRLWASASLYWDGRVATCCYDHGEFNILGDLREASLLEVWNSPRVREFRRRYRQMDPCRTCADDNHQFLPHNLAFLVRTWLRKQV